jgi:3-oxoacyl-[acyl-carrier protein] reductase
VPLGRLADPREVADVIAFLLSDSSSYMTGQSVNVTGGMITY